MNKNTKKLFQDSKDYQALVHSVTNYVVAVNRNHQIIMSNNLFKVQFGLPSDNLCYKAWKHQDSKCERCIVDLSFRDGAIHESEETVVMKNGRKMQVLVKSTPVKNERNEILYVLETATDITERNILQNKLIETDSFNETVAERLKRLQESEERYRTIFERSSDAIILADVSGKVIEINKACINMLGYKDKEELLELKWVANLFEDHEDLFKLQKKISQEGFFNEFETRLVDKHGCVFDALVTSNAIADGTGKLTGYMAIIRNISKRKQAQKQIERQNTRLSILNTVSMKVGSSLDLDEVLNSTVNKIIEILEPDNVRIYLLDETGGTLNLAVHKGLSSKFVRKDHMKRRKAGDGLLGKAVLDGKAKVVDNYLRAEDPYVDSFIEEGLQSTAYIPFVSKGKPVGVMCVSSHSEFKFSSDYVEFLMAIGNQIGLAVDNANLYENIKKAYQELSDAQEQVIRSEKLASLGKLAATISHEINNPLAAVLNYIRLMIKLIARDRFVPDKLDDILRYLTTMESETARCGEIVKNLLAFSRHSKTTFEEHNIEDIIDRTLILIDHDLEIKEIRLEKNIQPDLPKVKCDFKQIQQALLNLMSNASEAMTREGMLTVTADYSNCRNFLEVVISDRGCGISEEDRENIFEPFFTTKEEGKGVGLGLSVAYGIITRHNGFIEVESEPDKGSSFKVCLPIVQ